MAGGLNAYGFASGDPVNYADPSGLCVPLCTALLGAAIGGGGAGLGTMLYNHAHGLPLTKNLGRNSLIGAVAGVAVGLGLGVVGGTVGASTTAATGTVVGSSTLRLIDALEQAGPSMDARIDAVSKWLPAGQRALETMLDGGARMLSGGAGERYRQIVLNTDGSTVIKAWNVGKEVFEVVRTIAAPAAR